MVHFENASLAHAAVMRPLQRKGKRVKILALKIGAL